MHPYIPMIFQNMNRIVLLFPVYNDNMLIMVNARVRGVVANPMEIIDFTEVFIKEPRKINS